MSWHRRAVLIVAIAAAAVAAGSSTALTQGTQTRCSASFHVLHDDRIGTLRLPEGAYQLRPTALSCLRASQLFTEFLADWDGVLPRPWDYTVDGVGRGEFTRGDGDQGFEAVRTGNATPGSPGHPADGGGSHGELTCPGTFEVEHNNRIGALRIARGQYTMTRLGVRLPCASVVRLFARFLEHPDGRLPGGWVLLAQQAEFVKGSVHYGFRVEPFAD